MQQEQQRYDTPDAIYDQAYVGRISRAIVIRLRTMSKTDKKKKKLLGTGEEQEWIEMQDLSAPQNQEISRKFAQMEGRDYIPPPVRPETNEYPDLSSSSAASKPLSSSNNSSPEKSRLPSSQYLEHKRREPSLPMIEATCDFCTVAQRVPGNTQVYCCGSCENMNECYPLYGIVLCGCCQVKVGFGFGMSEYIKCPKCSSVNKVPLEPVKQYQSTSVLGVNNVGQLGQHFDRQVPRGHWGGLREEAFQQVEVEPIRKLY